MEQRTKKPPAVSTERTIEAIMEGFEAIEAAYDRLPAKFTRDDGMIEETVVDLDE
jgi:hypothetical protein